MPDDRGEAEMIVESERIVNEWLEAFTYHITLSKDAKDLIVNSIYTFAHRVRQQAAEDCCKAMCPWCAKEPPTPLLKDQHVSVIGNWTVICRATAIREQGRGG